MFVEIDDGAAAVHDAADLKSLSVHVVASSEGADLSAGLRGLGVVAEDGAHVWLLIDALKAAAAATLPADQRSEWSTGFDGMIAYATAKGWTSADGCSVRAHIEPR
jgi:hypothetical protein